MTWDGIRFIASFAVKRGEGFLMEDAFFVHPSDWLLQVGKGRYPYETRMNLGMRELERDRRRHPRA